MVREVREVLLVVIDVVLALETDEEEGRAGRERRADGIGERARGESVNGCDAGVITGVAGGVGCGVRFGVGFTTTTRSRGSASGSGSASGIMEIETSSSSGVGSWLEYGERNIETGYRSWVASS